MYSFILTTNQGRFVIFILKITKLNNRELKKQQQQKRGYITQGNIEGWLVLELVWTHFNYSAHPGSIRSNNHLVCQTHTLSLSAVTLQSDDALPVNTILNKKGNDPDELSHRLPYPWHQTGCLTYITSIVQTAFLQDYSQNKFSLPQYSASADFRTPCILEQLFTIINRWQDNHLMTSMHKTQLYLLSSHQAIFISFPWQSLHRRRERCHSPPVSSSGEMRFLPCSKYDMILGFSLLKIWLQKYYNLYMWSHLPN